MASKRRNMFYENRKQETSVQVALQLSVQIVLALSVLLGGSIAAEFLANLQEQVLKDPGIGIRALSREMNVAASTMKLALNEDLRYYSYKRGKGQPLTEKAREKQVLRLTSDGYVELLNTVVKPWIRRVANGLNLQSLITLILQLNIGNVLGIGANVTVGGLSSLLDATVGVSKYIPLELHDL
ncbi:hypothetical protein AAG570_002381 [Ranatra chinensis]|uniref:Uncharacterized protein n=1 Tax=Ranatra chinensis TaxID=642074 RepID=A0ABD0Y7E2_9HEMI